MMPSLNAAIRTTFLALCCLAAPAFAAPDEAILLIDQVSGVAGVQRDGKRLALQPGDALQEQDLIVTDRSGRMTLRLGRHGFVEVGPNAEVGVERLPFAAYARDLKSIFSVSKGYFRVVWKHPQLSSTWPLFVYMAGHRISLVSGEYFFQNAGKDQRACVAAGQIALQAAGSEGVETIKPPSCAQLAATGPALVTPRNPDDWIAVRRGYSIEATAVTLLAREGGPAEPLPAAPAKPIINTAPTSLPSVQPPVAIAPPAPVVPAIDDFAAAAPEVSTSTAARSSVTPLGPVREAPVLPAPLPAPRTAMAPALPVFPPPVVQAPLATSSPIIIGQVQAAPVASKPAAAPVIAAAPVAPAPPKPVPAKPLVAAAPVSMPTSASGGSWALNIASYSEAGAAQNEAQRLRNAGYATAITQPAVVNGRNWHRVQVGGFASESAARAAALELKAKLGLQNIWVLKP